MVGNVGRESFCVIQIMNCMQSDEGCVSNVCCLLMKGWWMVRRSLTFDFFVMCLFFLLNERTGAARHNENKYQSNRDNNFRKNDKARQFYTKISIEDRQTFLLAATDFQASSSLSFKKVDFSILHPRSMTLRKK